MMQAIVSPATECNMIMAWRASQFTARYVPAPSARDCKLRPPKDEASVRGGYKLNTRMRRNLLHSF